MYRDVASVNAMPLYLFVKYKSILLLSALFIPLDFRQFPGYAYTVSTFLKSQTPFIAHVPN